ncbi:MAG: adenylate/guanylate cyclase domain-containing protein, partial [Candidatus Tectomicrobia bacterium]|nr:adenylate/guanylate cyclase domain-containing protein [Candidatus Tectomicrobia bacterium]
MDRPELSNRTWLCTVVFLDMVGYSKHSVTQQMTMKRRFNSRLTEAIAHVAVRDRIVLDTGDGAAICFMGDPEEALRVALHLYHGFREEAQSELLPVLVRIGIHVGPVKIMKDINGQLNTIGDGINVAQRIMSFAQPNQILVSRSFYEVVACLSYEYEQMFQYMGVQTDKHVREYMLYAIVASPEPPVPESARLY